MIAELPKLISKDFAIGFLLPGALLVASVLVMRIPADNIGQFESAITDPDSVGVISFVMMSFFVALLLMALNYPILRAWEGYGRIYPFKNRLIERKKILFRAQAAPAIAFQGEVDAARIDGRAEPVAASDHHTKLWRAVEDFPDTEEWVLPTRFGNLFRAFEVYPRVVYGLDAIPAWPRLLAVMPDRMHSLIGGAKAQLDFCVNIGVVGLLSMLIYGYLMLFTEQPPVWWIVFLPCLSSLLSYPLAETAARNFGAQVKSAFDLYRADLARQLGLELPDSMADERAMWRTVSRMMIYRSAARADELTRFRAPAGDRPRADGPGGASGGDSIDGFLRHRHRNTKGA